MIDSYDDHTLVITTFNRPRYLFRLLSFISRDLPIGQVRVVDGSQEPHRSDNQRVVAAFVHKMPVTLDQLEPGIDVLEHHRYAYCCAETPFMTFCHDDNFCVPEVIRESVRFLRAHPDYVNCCGLMAGLRRKNNRTVAFVCDGDRLEQEKPLERLAHFLANHWSADFGTWRSEARRMAVSTFDLYALDEAIGEPMSCGISALSGKFHLIPKLSVIFCVHDNNLGSGSADRKSSVIRPEFPNALTSVSKVLADFCRDCGVVPPSDGRAYYLTAYLRYMAKWWHQFRTMARGIRSLAEAGLSQDDLRTIDEQAEAAIVHDLLGLSPADVTLLRSMQSAVETECDPSRGELFIVMDSDVIIVDVPQPSDDGTTIMKLPQATSLPNVYRSLFAEVLRSDWHERYCALRDSVADKVLGRFVGRIDASEILDAAFLTAIVNLVRPLHGSHPMRLEYLARLLNIGAEISPSRDALLLAVAHCQTHPSPRFDDNTTSVNAVEADRIFRILGASPPQGATQLPLKLGPVAKKNGVAFIPIELSGVPAEHFRAGHPLWLCVEVAQVMGKMQFGLYDHQSLDLLVPITDRTGPRSLYFPIRSTSTEYLVMRDITHVDGPGRCHVGRICLMTDQRPWSEYRFHPESALCLEVEEFGNNARRTAKKTISRSENDEIFST